MKKLLLGVVLLSACSMSPDKNVQVSCNTVYGPVRFTSDQYDIRFEKDSFPLAAKHAGLINVKSKSDAIQPMNLYVSPSECVIEYK